jgi:hypothetical protein
MTATKSSHRRRLLPTPASFQPSSLASAVDRCHIKQKEIKKKNAIIFKLKYPKCSTLNLYGMLEYILI